MSMFKRATRQQVPLKLGITGPSGSGKTTAALRITRGLVGQNAPIAFLDTENGSASLYADITPFDVVNMNPPYAVVKFTKAIEEATQAGYKALIIDSASAEWQELLTEKEALDARGGNSFANWATITKKHEDFLKAIRNAPLHLVLCLRAKQEHVQDKDANGKTTVRKVGMAAIQREGMEFELTTVFDLAMDHNYKVSKDRTRLFDGRIEQVSEQTGRELAAWLSSGAQLTPQEPPSAPATATQATASPAAPEGTQASQPGAQSAAQPEAPVHELGAEYVELMAELAAVTLALGMSDLTRTKLFEEWEHTEDLAALRKEIATLKSTIPNETPREALQAQQEDALGRKTPVSQAASDFVDSVDPDTDTDEQAGGINPEQYQALNKLLEAFGVDRDCFRSHCDKAGHLLPGKNGPTLARLKAAEFEKFRAKLTNKTKAGKHPVTGQPETWSERTIRIINAVPKTTYAPIAQAS